ncbi:SDR family oxidoreductase [Caulobacter sp. S45]|uniref:SDR family oxidoreductase n=1 Tax=Caulobacter sp. S45 TaxID=1641861 RepID=UPI001575AD39|nr:SDR family oxidoreductase [Caulobacter sp. S45]
MTTAEPRRCIFITGAASGIGRATALLFAERGWFVGALDVDETGLGTLQAESQIGLARRLDVTDPQDYRAAVAAFAEHTGGRLDILFNNAGIIASSPLDEAPWEAVERLLRINLFGVMIGMQTALPLLKATPGSLCFSTCSASAIFGSANLTAYSASKHAVKGLTEALSIELKKHGVRAADVLPGIVDTAMLPPETRAMLPPDGPWRLVTPREVAEVVWRAYDEDRIHWYVPPELKDFHLMAVSEPEKARDYFISLGRG